MNKSGDFKLPFYAKITICLVGIFVFCAMIYIAKSILLPLVFATILAIILHPIVNFFVRIKINRLLAISLTLTLSIVFLGGFGSLVFSQLNRFSDSVPAMIDKFTSTINEIIAYFSIYYDIDPIKIHEWILKVQGELLNYSSVALGQTLSTLSSLIVAVFLIPVYTFFILYYEPLLLNFIRKLFGSAHQSQVSEVVSQTKTVIQRYLVGLVIEAAIVASLESTTLLIFGIEYAILLGILGALLNTIPYIGGLVAVALPMMVAMVTKTSGWYALYILIIYYVIQLIDNNYIIPKIVASKVKINALFSIIVVLVGNALWGIPGMFLSIPLLAIIKLIFDHVEPLKPWGFLLGDNMPSILELKPIFKKINNLL